METHQVIMNFQAHIKHCCWHHESWICALYFCIQIWWSSKN